MLSLRFSLPLLALMLAAASARAERRLRFAQLTDIHLSGKNPSHTDDLLRSIDRINSLDSVDFVIITGDLTDNGDYKSMQLNKECLSKLNVPYYAVMGNHETKWSESGCTAWKKVFGEERLAFRHGDVHFFCFNTGPLMRMAYGHVTAQDLAWLRAGLESVPKGEPIIVITHYPLNDKDMDNWYEATDLLRRYNVRLCIGGHFHRPCHYSYDGIPGVLMSSCCHDESHSTTFGLYDIAGDSISAWVCEDGKHPSLLCRYAVSGEVKDMDGNVLKPEAGNVQRLDSTDNILFPFVRKVWTCRTDASIYSSPVTDGRRIFVADDTGTLTAYRLGDGHPLWTFHAGARMVGTPAVQSGIVVVGSADRRIYGLSARNGRLLWQVEARDAVLGAVRISDGVAYVGASDHAMRAIDIRRGTVIWEYDDVEGYVETLPLVAEGKVIFGAWDNRLYCLDSRNGSLLWTWSTGRQDIHFSPAAVWPSHADGRIFIADPARALTAIDINTGQTVWRTYASMVRESAGTDTDGSGIVAKTMRDSVVCYNALSNEPEEMWACNVGFGYDHAPSMPVVRDGIVYGGTVKGLVYAIDAATGSLLWRHRVGNSLVNTVTPLGKGRLLYTSSDGRIGLLESTCPP